MGRVLRELAIIPQALHWDFRHAVVAATSEHTVSYDGSLRCRQRASTPQPYLPVGHAIITQGRSRLTRCDGRENRVVTQHVRLRRSRYLRCMCGCVCHQYVPGLRQLYASSF